MSIYKMVTLPTGEAYEYHRVVHGEVNYEEGVFTVTVASWANRNDYLLQRRPARNSFELSLDVISTVEAVLVSDGLFDGGVIVSDENTEGTALEKAKASKNAAINAARMSANTSSFTHAGKAFSCDRLSRSDIDGVNGLVSIINSLPPGWPGAWKAVDNTYHLIPDVTAWVAFYGAMVATGTAHFAHSQALKALLVNAGTPAEVAEIHWGMVL